MNESNILLYEAEEGKVNVDVILNDVNADKQDSEKII